MDLDTSGEDARGEWVPALGSLGASFFLHVVALSTGWFGCDARPVKPPVVAVSRGEVAVVIERPTVRRRDRRVARVGEASRPTSKSVVLPRATPREPEPALAGLTAPSIERVVSPREILPEPTVSLERMLVPEEELPSEEAAQSPRLASEAGRPKYPAACKSGRHKKGGCEGRGVYEVHVDQTGKVLGVRTVRSAGCVYLDRSVELFFLHRAKFTPATRAGVAVEWRGRMSVVFDLEDERDSY